MHEGVPQPANSNEAPKLSPEEMEAAIEAAQHLHRQLVEEYDDKDFVGSEAVVKKKEIDTLSVSLTELLKFKVPNEQRAASNLPYFPRYEGPAIARDPFPDEAPHWYQDLVGYNPQRP